MQVSLDVEYEATDTEPVQCWLCERADRVVYRGLATLGIYYPPGAGTRFICDDCISKVKET